MLNQIFIIAIISRFCLSKDVFVQLNHDLGPDSKIWPAGNAAPFTTTPFNTENKTEICRSPSQFCSPEHIGTHVDAPSHYSEGAWSVDQIPVEHLIGPGCVINIKSKVDSNPLHQLSPSDVSAWITQHGMFPNGSIVIAMTGWGKRYGGSVLGYFGSETNETQFVFPGVDPSVVEMLLQYKESHGVHIAGLGIDDPSLDYGMAQDFPSHKLMSAANVFGIQNLINLQYVPATGSELTVMPVKIRGGSGAPCRVIARIPEASKPVSRN